MTSFGGDLREILVSSGVTNIQGVYTRHFLPSPMSPEELEKRLEDVQKQVTSDAGDDPVRQDSAKHLMQKIRASYTDGVVAKYLVAVQTGPNATLASFRQTDADSGSGKATTTWNYLDKDRLIEFDDGGSSVVISSSNSPERALVGTLLFDLGSWGNPQSFAHSDLKFDKENLLQGKILYPAGERTISFGEGKSFVSSEVTKIGSGESPQVEIREFSAFKTYGEGLLLPEVASNSFSSEEVKYENKFEIAKVGLETQGRGVPDVSLPQFGYVTVTDARMVPPFVFRAFNSLPSDDEIALLASDPARLKNYNERALKAATGK